MNNSSIEERAILGLPIITEFGEMKPLSIQEYIQRSTSLGVIAMDKKKVLAELGKGQQAETGQSDKEVFNLLTELNNSHTFLSLLKEYFTEILNHYIIITCYCKFYYLEDTKEDYENEEEYNKDLLMKSADFIINLSDEAFDSYRRILLQLNGVSEITSKINPVLYKREDKPKTKSKEDDETPNLSTMISSCAVHMGIDYKDIAKWNSLQLQHSFQRIGLFIANSERTLFRTVSDEVEPVAWTTNISTNKNRNKDQSLEQFTNSMSGYVK